MKGKLISLCTLLALFCFSGPVYSDDYSSETGLKKEWFLSKEISRLNSSLAGRVEGYINSITPENIYGIIGREIGKAFGNAFSDTFSGMISIGPFVSIDSIIGSFGKSESQVMTATILRAIQEAKEEIIAAVQESDRYTTRVMLESLIQNLDIYNARDVSIQPAMLTDLLLMSQDATVVRNRIALSSNFSLEDIHSYMLVASLQLSILRDIATWTALDQYPDADEEFINQEIRATFGSVLGFMNSHFMSSRVSTLSYWRSEFESEFSNVRFDRLANLNDIPVGMRNDYSWAGSAVYKYTMANKDVSFLLLRVKDSCDLVRDGGGGVEVFIDYHMYDPKNNYLGNGHAYYGLGGVLQETYEEQGCSSLDNSIVNQINRSQFSFFRSRNIRSPSVAYRAHMQNEDAFYLYLAEGYIPIKKMLDSWWDLNRDDVRVLSEIDSYVASNVEIYPDINLSFYEDDGDSNNYFMSLSNIGGAVASSTKMVIYEPSNVAPTKLYVFNDQTETYEQYAACQHYPGFLTIILGRLECDFGDVQDNGSFSIMLEVDGASGGWWPAPRRYRVATSLSNKEIIVSNNELSLVHNP